MLDAQNPFTNRSLNLVSYGFLVHFFVQFIYKYAVSAYSVFVKCSPCLGSRFVYGYCRHIKNRAFGIFTNRIPSTIGGCGATSRFAKTCRLEDEVKTNPSFFSFRRSQSIVRHNRYKSGCERRAERDAKSTRKKLRFKRGNNTDQRNFHCCPIVCSIIRRYIYNCTIRHLF